MIIHTGFENADINTIYSALKEEQWAFLSKQEKVNILQEVENRYANICKREACEVVLKPAEMMDYAFGGYENQKISINEMLLDNRKVENSNLESLNTVLHEGFHSWQDQSINESIPLEFFDQAKVEKWRINDSPGNYQDKNDIRYWVQPIEKDARDFANAETERITKELHINNDPQVKVYNLKNYYAESSKIYEYQETCNSFMEQGRDFTAELNRIAADNHKQGNGIVEEQKISDIYDIPSTMSDNSLVLTKPLEYSSLNMQNEESNLINKDIKQPLLSPVKDLDQPFDNQQQITSHSITNGISDIKNDSIGEDLIEIKSKNKSLRTSLLPDIGAKTSENTSKKPIIIRGENHPEEAKVFEVNKSPEFTKGKEEENIKEKETLEQNKNTRFLSHELNSDKEEDIVQNKQGCSIEMGY